MANTFTLISTTTVGAGGAANITFSSVPATFTDVKIVVSGRSSYAASGDSMYLTINGSTTGFTSRYLYGNTGAGTAASGTLDRWGGYVDAATDTTNTHGSTELYFPNYAGSTNKSYSIESVYETNAAGIGMIIFAGLWSNTSAITSIVLTPANGSFVQYSTASIYGILKGSGGATVS